MLCVNGNYDFVANKLIPKPDPSHPMKRLSTNMFAFSKSSWKGRAEFHLGKGISKLKEKDWTKIMTAAAKYSIFISKSKSSASVIPEATGPTEEERELEWESDED
jgi:hypothetical protein